MTILNKISCQNNIPWQYNSTDSKKLSSASNKQQATPFILNEINNCKARSISGSTQNLFFSIEEKNSPVIKEFLNLIENDKLLTRDEIDGIAPLLCLLGLKGASQDNVHFSDESELKLVNNLIKLAGHHYQKEISGPTIKFLDYLNQSNLYKDGEISNIINLACAAINFAKLEFGSIRKTREIVSKFLGYFKSAESYKEQTTLEKMLFKLDVMVLAAHLGPNVSKLTSEFLDSLEKNKLCKDHPLSEMAKSILEEKENFSVIREFFKLTERDELKKAIVGFLALSAGEETWVGYKKADELEEEMLRQIGTDLLRFANDQDTAISKPILDFASYSRGSKNQDALDIAAVIESFSKLETLSNKSIIDIGVFKNTLLDYLQTDDVAEEGNKKEVFIANLRDLANMADSAEIYDLLSGLSEAKPWQGHWISNLATTVLEEKEKSSPAIKALMELVEIRKGKDKKNLIKMLALSFLTLLDAKKNEEAERVIKNKSFMEQVNHLLSRLYNKDAGELQTLEGGVLSIMNFLTDLAQSRKWRNQDANALALEVADVIVAFKVFWELKPSSDKEIINERIKEFKNNLLGCLQINDASKKAEDEDKKIAFLSDLPEFMKMQDAAISEPARRLITCLSKSEALGDHWMASDAKTILRQEKVSPFIEKFFQLREKEILQEEIVDTFLGYLMEGETRNLISEGIEKKLNKTEEELLIWLEEELVHIANQDGSSSEKRVSKVVTDLLNHVKNEKEWEGLPVRSLATNILEKVKQKPSQSDSDESASILQKISSLFPFSLFNQRA